MTRPLSELRARLRQRHAELSVQLDTLTRAVAALDGLIKAIEHAVNLDEPAISLFVEALLAGLAKESVAVPPAVEVDTGEARPGRRPPRDDGKQPYGIAPVASRVLRAVFSLNTDRPLPATLEEALEGVYGGNWEACKVVQQTAGPGRIVATTLGEDLSQGVESVLRRDLKRGAERLWHFHRGTVPQGHRPSRTLVNIHRVIDVDKQWGTIVATLGNWGIRLEPN